MHGVGTQQNTLRARTLQPERGVRQHLPGFVPLPARLAGFYFMEIHAVQQQAGRMQTAQTLFDAFINQAVVRDC